MTKRRRAVEFTRKLIRSRLNGGVKKLQHPFTIPSLSGEQTRSYRPFPLRLGIFVGALCIAAYFWLNAGDGLGAYFTTDDLINMTMYQAQSWAEIVKSNLLFFSPAYRPAGALFYRPIFEVFGFQPLPYRIGCFLILGANLLIAAAFVRAMTRSWEAALISVLIASFHPRMADLYWSTGTIYDILCFAFFYAALTLYIRGSTGGFFVSYVLALNAKEMAVAIPPLTLGWELLCGGANMSRRILVPLIAVAMALAYIPGKLSSASPFQHLDRYRPTLSLEGALTTYGSYLGQLIYRDAGLTPLLTGLVLLISLMLATLLRSRALVFCWLLAVVGCLPITFIPPRNAFAFYIPMIGWTTYIAILIVRMREATLARAVPVSQVATFAAVLLLLMRAHRIQRLRMGGPELLGQRVLRTVVSELHSHAVRPPRGATVLSVGDPFQPDEYGLKLLLNLYTHDASLTVVHGPMDNCSYAYSLEWSGVRLARVRTGPC